MALDTATPRGVSDWFGDLFCNRCRICTICLLCSSTDVSNLVNLISHSPDEEAATGWAAQIFSASSAKLTDQTAFALFLKLSRDLWLCIAYLRYSNASSVLFGYHSMALQAVSESTVPCKNASTAVQSNASGDMSPKASVANWWQQVAYSPVLPCAFCWTTFSWIWMDCEGAFGPNLALNFLFTSW